MQLGKDSAVSSTQLLIGDQQSRSVAVCAVSLFHDYKSLYMHILLIVTLYSAPSKLAYFLKFSWSKH